MKSANVYPKCKKCNGLIFMNRCYNKKCELYNITLEVNEFT